MKIQFCLTFKFLFAIFLINGQSITPIDSTLLLNNDTLKNSVLLEREMFFAENSYTYDIAFIKKIDLLFIQKKFIEASFYIKQNIKNISNDTANYKALEKLAYSLFKNGEYDECNSYLEKLSYNALANKNWINFLKILCNNEQRSWAKSKKIYEEIIATNNLNPSLINVFSKTPVLKNINKASWLATIIPAGGFFYMKKYDEAIISLALQFGFLYYGYISFINKYYLNSWLIGGGLAGSFYMGGQRRAEQLVNKYNQKESIIFNTKVKKELTEIMSPLL